MLELVTGWLYRRATGTEVAADPYRMVLKRSDVVDPPRRLDMFEDLDRYINGHTEVRDGVRVVVDR